MGDTGGGGAHERLGLGIDGAHRLGQALLDRLAGLRERERQAVVAIDGALDARSPRERLVGTKEDGLDTQQVLCDGNLIDHVMLSNRTCARGAGQMWLLL